MEILVKWKIIAHLEVNNLIGDSQHGFRNKRSWLTSQLDFFARVIDTYDAGNSKAVDLIYFYFQKAFDKVPQKPGGQSSKKISEDATDHEIPARTFSWNQASELQHWKQSEGASQMSS